MPLGGGAGPARSAVFSRDGTVVPARPSVLDAPRRRAKIVATLGPASRDEPMLESLLAAGVDVVRLNFSHGEPEEHAALAQVVRRLAAKVGRHVAILQDLAGPKIRTGPLEGGQPIPLRPGEEIVVTTDLVPGRCGRISTTYRALAADVRPGGRLLLADGAMQLEVLASDGHEIRARVIDGGLLGEHQGINLPGVTLSTPALTAKDLGDLALGLKLGVDFIALSFVQSAADVRAARRAVRERGGRTPLIAKLEKPQGVDDLPAILAAADGVMVARGDLGVELPPERVPVLQKRIISAANAAAVPVITATQMLESMVSQPRPTRAEASDVANAIFDGTDAVMLSAETAIGRYPVEAVRTMARIVLEAEALLLHEPQRERARGRHASATHAQAIAEAACRLAEDLHARAIVVLAAAGGSARLVSHVRPAVPVIACADDAAACRRLTLLWGVEALLMPFTHDLDATIGRVEQELVRSQIATPGDLVVVVGSSPVLERGRTNFVKVHRVGDPEAPRAAGFEAPDADET